MSHRHGGPGRRLMIHLARDITARRRLEPREQQGEHLKLIGAMAAGLAHEIRTPLTSISNGARALQDMLPELDGDARLAIDIIAKEAARVATLLTDVLSLARPRSPRVSPEDLCQLVADAVAVARRSRPQAEAVVVDVAAGAATVEALVDRDQVMQALLNVVGNALDACLAGRSAREPRVTVRLARPADGERFCRVMVLDTGPGITPEDRPRLFEPFFSRKPSGTGLGLAITRRIVEAHGGRLEVEDAPGGGAAFVLHLPAAEPGGHPDGRSSDRLRGDEAPVLGQEGARRADPFERADSGSVEGDTTTGPPAMTPVADRAVDAEERLTPERTVRAPVATGGLPGSRLRRVTEHIQNNLHRELRLAELSALVHMSPYHFARLFKRSTGLPPHRFVVRRRIDRATALLAARELSIGEIARSVGFRTPSHFTTVFRRITGRTPSEYRAGADVGGPSG